MTVSDLGLQAETRADGDANAISMANGGMSLTRRGAVPGIAKIHGISAKNAKTALQAN